MNRLIVLDANILIRGILGEQVSRLLEQYNDQVRFFTTDGDYSAGSPSRKRITISGQQDLDRLFLEGGVPE